MQKRFDFSHWCLLRTGTLKEGLICMSLASCSGKVRLDPVCSDAVLMRTLGSFGTVRLAHHKITGYKVAVKTYEKSKMKDDKQLRRCKQEIKLMERLNSNYVVRLFETIETSKRLHIGTSLPGDTLLQTNVAFSNGGADRR